MLQANSACAEGNFTRDLAIKVKLKCFAIQYFIIIQDCTHLDEFFPREKSLFIRCHTKLCSSELCENEYSCCISISFNHTDDT